MVVAALQPWAEISQRLRRILIRRPSLLFVFFVFLTVRFFDSKLFQTILKRAEGEAEELGGLGDVVVGLVHRLCDQIAFDFFKIDPLRR